MMDACSGAKERLVVIDDDVAVDDVRALSATLAQYGIEVAALSTSAPVSKENMRGLLCRAAAVVDTFLPGVCMIKICNKSFKYMYIFEMYLQCIQIFI